MHPGCGRASIPYQSRQHGTSSLHRQSSARAMHSSSVSRHEQPPGKVSIQSKAQFNCSTAQATPRHSHHAELRKAQLRHVTINLQTKHPARAIHGSPAERQEQPLGAVIIQGTAQLTRITTRVKSRDSHLSEQCTARVHDGTSTLRPMDA